MTSKKEYGDYQTPAQFAEKCVKYLKDNFHFSPEMIIEPACGIGNFLASAGKFYVNIPKVGIEINDDYCKAAKKKFQKHKYIMPAYLILNLKLILIKKFLLLEIHLG